jgi:hypothetical protein
MLLPLALSQRILAFRVRRTGVMPPRRKRPKLVQIVWEDIAPHEGSWLPRATIKPQPAVMESVGWLLRNDPDYVILAQDYDHKDNMVAGVTTYPQGCVRTVTEIGVSDGEGPNC